MKKRLDKITKEFEIGKKFEKFSIKFCEFSPSILTIYEKKGKCTKPNKICQYCKPLSNEENSCNKFTYLFGEELSVIK